MPTCLPVLDPYGSIGNAMIADLLSYLEADAERQIIQNGVKALWQPVLPLGHFLEEETDSDETSSSQYTEDSYRSPSPCPTLSTSGESCADSDFSSDDGVRQYSNRRKVQSKTSSQQCGSGLHYTVIGQEENDQSSKDDGGDDDRRDDSSSEMTLDLDMRFKKRDEVIYYACPFRKRHPRQCNFRTYPECAVQSFSDLERVREHLGRCHLRFADESSQDDKDATLGRSVYTNDPALWMTAETFEAIKSQADESASPRQKWEHIWRCLFGQTDHVLEPDFEAPIEAEELVHELQRSLHEFDAQVRREVEGLTPIPSSSSALASLGARITELWVQYLNSTVERCERKVRGSSSLRLALSRRATTDVVSHRPVQSGSDGPSHGLTTKAKTFDCFRTMPATLEIVYPGLEAIVSSIPSLSALSPCLEQYEASPTPTLSGSSTILDGSIHEEPASTLTNHPSASGNVAQSCQELDDASDSSSCSNEEEQDDDEEETEDDTINEIISRVSSVILGVLTPNPPNHLIQAVQSAVESFVVELFNDVLFSQCPHDGGASSSSNSNSNGSSVPPQLSNSSSTSSAGFGANGQGHSEEDHKEDGSEQGDRLPGPGNVVNHDGCSNPLWCPFRIRNPVKFNSRDFPGCANKQWVSMNLLKRHIRSVHRRKNGLEYTCPRCKEGFPTSESLTQHSEKENACKIVPSAGNKAENPEDGLSADVIKRMDNRKTQGKVQSWQALWRLLFPLDTDVPPHILPNEIQGLTQSFQEKRPNLDEAIGSTISQFVPEDVADDLANKLSTLFQSHVNETLRHHGVTLGGARSFSRAPSARPKSVSPSSSASTSSVEDSAAPANKKRKSRHIETEIADQTVLQTPTTMVYETPSSAATEPDMTGWTDLGSRIQEQSIPSPGPQYPVSQPTFQNGPSYVQMGMMMNNTGYSTISPSPVSSSSIGPAFTPDYANQRIMDAMNNNMNHPNNIGITFRFCPSCGGQWPCAAHWRS